MELPGPEQLYAAQAHQARRQHQSVYPIQLPPGEWSIAPAQDLNENDWLDRNMIGITTDSFSLSKIGHPRFKVPTFENCKHTVSGVTTTVAISMK